MIIRVYESIWTGGRYIEKKNRGRRKQLKTLSSSNTSPTRYYYSTLEK